MYTEVANGSTQRFDLSMANIFQPLLISNSAKFILAYNNVSGSSDIGDADKSFCKRVLDASHIMGIEFVDHIIIADGDYASVMKEIKQ